MEGECHSTMYRKLNRQQDTERSKRVNEQHSFFFLFSGVDYTPQCLFQIVIFSSGFNLKSEITPIMVPRVVCVLFKCQNTF